ncbi:hypothetical protein HOR70_gp22 [Pectobacterium phage PPWS4]|uniref:Uncharacterized protein n=1 Tax=Pectobacterium phage PPWS4 TaxID=1961914 RepID=A0A250KA81_9CAUD|nr:hypothetical protein HOR70_gp22 [Pectobacterium phage PPWS4]BBA26437.1 hypothetical protein [Pectobacterium phage PPWS4]
MRTRVVIEQEIKKLQTELAEVNEIESSRDAAVHILGNLGWRRDCGRWIAPAVKHPPIIEFDSDAGNPFREGDWVKHKVFNQYFRVKGSERGLITVQQFSHRVGKSLFCQAGLQRYGASNLRACIPPKFVNRKEKPYAKAT